MDFSSYTDVVDAASSSLFWPMLIAMGAVPLAVLIAPSASKTVLEFISKGKRSVLYYGATLIFMIAAGSSAIFSGFHSDPLNEGTRMLQEQLLAEYDLDLTADEANSLMHETTQGTAIRIRPSAFINGLDTSEEELYRPASVTLPNGEPGNAQLIWTGDEWIVELYTVTITPYDTSSE